MEEIQTKKCPHCQQVLSLDNFNKSKNKSLGVRSWCKSCEHQRYINNKDKILKQQKEYLKNNKEKINKRQKEHYYKNIEKHLAQKKADYQKHKEKRNQSSREYAKNNPEKIRKISLAYYHRHKDLINKKNRERRKNDSEFRERSNKLSNELKKRNRPKLREQEKRRFENNPQAKMIARLRKRTCEAIKRLYKSQKETGIFYQLTGCDREFLIKYLESKFYDSKDGTKMTWENHGSNYGFWQVDHIKPCFTFDLSKKEEQLKCFHFSNLQPLWFEDHVEKTNRDIVTYKNCNETTQDLQTKL